MTALTQGEIILVVVFLTCVGKGKKQLGGLSPSASLWAPGGPTGAGLPCGESPLSESLNPPIYVLVGDCTPRLRVQISLLSVHNMLESCVVGST